MCNTLLDQSTHSPLAPTFSSTAKSSYRLHLCTASAIFPTHTNYAFSSHRALQSAKLKSNSTPALSTPNPPHSSSNPASYPTISYKQTTSTPLPPTPSHSSCNARYCAVSTHTTLRKLYTTCRPRCYAARLLPSSCTVRILGGDLEDASTAKVMAAGRACVSLQWLPLP